MLAVTAEWAARLDDADGRGRDLAIAAHRVLAARFCAARGLTDLARPIAEPVDVELDGFRAALERPELGDALRSAPIEVLGQAYEQWIGVAGRGRSRKREGVYYTPEPVVAALLDHLFDGLERPDGAAPKRVLDPACGGAGFLLAAYRRLLASATSAPARVLEQCIFGVDRDPYAIEIARLSLLLAWAEAGGVAPRPRVNLVCADALAPATFDAIAAAGFDVVVGNPPWGQKAIAADDAVKRSVRAAFPSCRGIFDWFRPFVELGVRLTVPGGRFGMVLPDVVLLKNYEPTRRLMLDELALSRIEWLGSAFPSATIDAVTVAGRRAAPGPGHRVRAIVNAGRRRLDHEIAQADFRANPRSTFNLHLTAEKRRRLRAIAAASRLGDYFEVHEGIHSGNIRTELFVDSAVDDSCRELLFGRDELRPYALRWAGRFVRLSAVPERRTRARYANLGRSEWHQRDKVVVRRTGDRVCAAVDRSGRFATNNFFVVLARAPHPLGLDGLCALLNSEPITWYFRTVEPRTGRPFAELKIKHLVDFPIPEVCEAEVCARLDQLGASCRRAASNGDDLAGLQREVDAAVVASSAGAAAAG